MTMPIALRSDFAADDLRRLARRSRDASQARRLLAEIAAGAARGKRIELWFGDG